MTKPLSKSNLVVYRLCRVPFRVVLSPILDRCYPEPPPNRVKGSFGVWHAFQYKYSVNGIGGAYTNAFVVHVACILTSAVYCTCTCAPVRTYRNREGRNLRAIEMSLAFVGPKFSRITVSHHAVDISMNLACNHIKIHTLTLPPPPPLKIAFVSPSYTLSSTTSAGVPLPWNAHKCNGK